MQNSACRTKIQHVENTKKPAKCVKIVWRFSSFGEDRDDFWRYAPEIIPAKQDFLHTKVFRADTKLWRHINSFL